MLMAVHDLLRLFSHFDTKKTSDLGGLLFGALILVGILYCAYHLLVGIIEIVHTIEMIRIIGIIGLIEITEIFEIYRIGWN